MLSATVGTSVPFQRTTENALKPVPVSVNVSGRPKRAVGGSTDVSVGDGLVTGVSAAMALKIRTRGIVMLPSDHSRVSVTGTPVFRNAARMSSIVALGAAWRTTAHAPATCGA